MYWFVRHRGIVWVVSLGLLAILAACGGATARDGDACGDPHRRTPPSPAPRTVDCGAAYMQYGSYQDAAAARRAQECVWQAYQRCATLDMATFAFNGDAATEVYTTRSFTLRGKGGGCTIAVEIVGQVLRPPPPGGAQIPANRVTGTCTGLTREADGTLHFLACGQAGEIVVPAAGP